MSMERSATKGQLPRLRILNTLLPQNNTFFIATAGVVKDTADNPDCQGLRKQWYYLQFYVSRTMRPTALYTYE